MARPIPFPETERGQEPALFHVQNWGGLNTRAKRPAVEDNQFSWLENYIPIGPGNLRTLYSNGNVLFTAPAGTTIIYSYFFNLFLVPMVAVFLSDGTATQVTLATGAQVPISSNVNEFYAGGYLPAAAQWTAQGIIIVTEAQNPQGYFAWDGKTLYRPGQLAPPWLDDGAGTSLPSGIHGNAVEVYQQRAIVTTPPEPGGIPTVKSISAPGNGASFSAVDGGVSIPQQDSVLRGTFTALKKANGFLYEFGDSSITVLGNLQTVIGGGGAVTTFSEQDVDPQSGTTWPNTVQNFGTAIIFANPQGVQFLAGGQVQKISQELDGIFEKADFGALTPSAAVAVIFGVKVYCLLLRSTDTLGTMRNYMCCFNGREWFIGTQDRDLKLIFSQELNSILTAWGSDGEHLFPLFTTPSGTLSKLLQSKFFAGDQQNAGYIKFKKLMRFYFMLQDNAGVGVSFSGTFDSDFANASLNVSTLTAVNNAGAVIQAQNVQNQNIYAVNFGILAATFGFFEFTNASGGVIHFSNAAGVMLGTVDGSINLTNAGQTATLNTVVNPSTARNVSYQVTGKWYTETTFTVRTGALDLYGIALQSTTSAEIQSFLKSAVITPADGKVWNNGVQANAGIGPISFGPLPPGTRVDMAVDLINKQIWFRPQGFTWNNMGTAGQPDAIPAGSGGINISAWLTEPAAPVVQFGGAGLTVGDSMTAVGDGGPFLDNAGFAPPPAGQGVSGFAGWPLAAGSGGIILWGVSALSINGTDAVCYGRLLGVTLGTTASDFALMALTLEYNYDAPFLG